MSYFSFFEKGYYDIDGTGNSKLVTDLMTRVKVREKIINEVTLYDSYDVISGEKPEDVAFKHFGSANLHWVILLTNNVTDRYYGWPLSEQDFERYVKDKYTNPDGIHHYEKVQSSGPQTSSDFSHLVEVNSTTPGALSVSNREYEAREQDKKRQIKLLNANYLTAFLEEFEKLVGV